VRAPSPAFLERLATAAVDEQLVDAFFAHVETPLGRLLVVHSTRGVCRIAFPENGEDRLLAEIAAAFGPRIVACESASRPTLDALAAYLEGDSAQLQISVDLALVRSAFGRAVLAGLARVPRGEVTTYGALAAAIGHPRAARATGSALGRNPVPIVVPCHRVVPGSGGVGHYGGGAERKRHLLELERAGQAR